jgi:hypothetical protein
VTSSLKVALRMECSRWCSAEHQELLEQYQSDCAVLKRLRGEGHGFSRARSAENTRALAPEGGGAARSNVPG